MLSDETFPEELLIDEENEKYESLKSTRSLENLNSYFSAENSQSSDLLADINKSMVDSINIEHLITTSDLVKMTNSTTELKQQQQKHTEVSFKSMDESSAREKLRPPSAPIKKRKSYSCQDLQLRKNSSNNYDHVESKVKKLIENLKDDRRKPFNRTKSMPVCAVQAPTIDDESNEKSPNVSVIDLRREIRKKSIKIYELEERCETKDAEIYELQYEKAKMRRTFDDLRQEIDKLKNIEQKYNQMQMFSPDKTQKSVLIQTENHDYDTSRQLLLVDSTERPAVYKTQSYQPSAVRNLTFNDGFPNLSAINNTSSDHLIPFESDITVEELEGESRNAENLNETASMADESCKKKKKTKKKFRFFKLMQCISGK